MRTAPLADGDWEHVGEGLKTDLAGAFSPEVGLPHPTMRSLCDYDLLQMHLH